MTTMHSGKVWKTIQSQQFGAVEVAAGDGVDERAEHGQFVGIDAVAPRAHRGDHAPGFDEERELVGIDHRTGVAADVDIRPLVDQLVLAVLGDRDELPLEPSHLRSLIRSRI
ncbi:hypothetical protein [Nocardia sputi]|uniref:hypothetical protein n=1 Tax=Nocardia sputi TaxID=2943705 RepID=UPI0020C05BB0|nr:hypothetical protein [Nocardia sputi]